MKSVNKLSSPSEKKVLKTGKQGEALFFLPYNNKIILFAFGK